MPYRTATPNRTPPMLITLAALCVGNPCINAAPLEEVIVSATRSDQTLKHLPFQASRIDQQSVAEQLTRNLPEALAETPGVLVQKTANGQGSPFLRGFTGYRTLMLIDGVRYNNSVYRDGPNEYFSLVDVGAVESIDVIKGPASTLYGSDAIGGTLSITTKNAAPKHKRHQPINNDQLLFDAAHKQRYSSAEDSQIQHTEIRLGQAQRWGIYGSISQKNFGDLDAAKSGEQPHTGYDEQALNLRADIQLNEQWSLTFAHQSLTQDDVWRTHSTVYATSFEGTKTGTDLRRLKDQNRDLSYLKVDADNPLPWLDQLTVTLSQQHWQEDGDRIKANQTQLIESFDSAMRGIDLAALHATESGEMRFGFDYYIDRVNSARSDYSADGSLAESHIQGPVGDSATFKQGGAYFQYQHDFNDRLTLTWASRYNIVDSSIGRLEDPETRSASSYHDHWNSWVHSLRGNLSLSETQSIWGAASQSFRAPNIADVSRYGKSRSNEFEVAATNLSPEQFVTLELGYKLSSDRWWLNASAYHTDISDYITSTPTGRFIDGLTEVSKRNSADGEVYGVELDWRYDWTNTLNAFGGITWLRGELDTFNSLSSTAASREPMSRIMPATLTLGARWQITPRWWSRISATHADKATRLSGADQQDLERIPPGGTPAYTLVNVYSGFQINQHLDVTLGIENLLDENYRSHGSGSNEPGVGMNLGITLRL